MSVVTQIVTEDEADTRLDRWFRRHYAGLSQGAIEKLCRTGQVRVDGRRVEASARLAPGQSVRIPPLPQMQAPPVRERPLPDLATERAVQAMVIHRDEQVIAINKPPKLAVQGGPGIVRHLDGMLDALRFGAPDRPRLVHRIDRDTSGVLLLARTPGVAAKLAALFRGREVQKTYWAVVAGVPDPGEGRIDRPLMRVTGARGARSATAEDGMPRTVKAITDYRTLDHAGKAVALMALMPLTGRTHQLRVHCASLGHPILGDAKYGEAAEHLDGVADRLHLHARALVLPHPAGGTLRLLAEPPAHMVETFRRLGLDPGDRRS